MESGGVKDKIRFFLSRSHTTNLKLTSQQAPSTASSSSSSSSTSTPSSPCRAPLSASASSQPDPVGSPRLGSSSSDTLSPSSLPSVVALFPSNSPDANLLESERKSRFIRNLRFFKEASKRHINDFHRSPAGSKYRSSSNPDIHQQLTTEESRQLGLAGDRYQQKQKCLTPITSSAKGKEKEQVSDKEQNRHEEDREAAVRKRGRTLLPDFQCAAQTNSHAMSDSMIAAIVDGKVEKDQGISDHTKGKPSDDTTRRENESNQDPPRESKSTSATQTDSSAKEAPGTDTISGDSVQVTTERKDDSVENSSSLTSPPAIHIAATPDGVEISSRPTGQEASVTFKTPYPVTRRKSVGEPPEEDRSGTAIMYKLMSEGARHHSKHNSSDSATVHNANSETKDKPLLNGIEKKPSDSERKKSGGLIARYKNLVANIEKDKERNADIAKSLTESAVARKKKKEKEREEKDKLKEDDKVESEKESESRRKRRMSSKKEKASSKKEEQAKKKQSGKTNKKKKKKMKESSEGSGKKDKRNKKGIGSRTNSANKMKSKDEVRSKHSEQRQPEVDGRLRELLRKLSITPPPARTSETTVHAIRRRLLTGDPFTVVLHSDVSWHTAGRGAIAKPSRTLGSKSSRIDSDNVRRLDSAEGVGAPTTTNEMKPRPASANICIATKHDSSGRESGSERKGTAPLSASMPSQTKPDSISCTRTDIRLFGVDGQLVIEESDEGEDWDKEFVGGAKSVKLSSPGGILNGLVIEESDEESAMAESSTSANKPEKHADSEEEDEDWEKEFASKDSSPKTARANITAKATKPVVDSESEEDWDKELADEEAKKNVTRTRTALEEKQKSIVTESEDEDWDKELEEEEAKKNKEAEMEASTMNSKQVDTEEEDEDWEKEFEAEQAPRMQTNQGKSTANSQKASAAPAPEEDEDEDWAKEFDEQEKEGSKREGIALNLEPVKNQSEPLDKWGEGSENDRDSGFDEAAGKLIKPRSAGSGGSENGSRTDRGAVDTEDDEEDWTKAFGDGSVAAESSSGKSSNRAPKKTGSKRQMRKEEKARAKEKEKDDKEKSKRASLGVPANKGNKREKRKRTKSSAAARRIESEGRQPSPHSTTSPPSTPRSAGSSRASSLRSLHDEYVDRRSPDYDLPPKGRFSVFKVQYLHSRSPKWIERERSLQTAFAGHEAGNSDGDKLAALSAAVANTSIMASFSSFLSPRIPSKKESVAKLGRSNRDLSTPNSRDGSTLSSSTSTAGPYVPFHPPSFETIGWDPVDKQWSRKLCRAHYVDDLTVTLRLLNEDLILIYDQVFRFDGRGVLYSWSAGSKIRETNFYDVYAALVEKEGESGEEVGYLADL